MSIAISRKETSLKIKIYCCIYHSRCSLALEPIHAAKTQTGFDVLAQPGIWLSQVTDISLPETRAVQGQLKLIQKGKFTALGDKHR